MGDILINLIDIIGLIKKLINQSIGFLLQDCVYYF